MIKGPVLILGAGGFIGSSIFKALTGRDDVFGTINGNSCWRVNYSPNLIKVDLLKELEWVLLHVSPKTIINCAAYGSFSEETLVPKIYKTNFELVYRILHWMDKDCIYVHAGTSSEYGFNSICPKEDTRLTPNSNYAVSKAAASHVVEYFGKQLGYKCCNLRLYSVYGPWEAYSRLMPKLVARGHEKKLPEMVNPFISRDFVYIDDVVKAFLAAAEALDQCESMQGESYNICTGTCTYIYELVNLARKLFGITEEASYNMAPRLWDGRTEWYGDNEKASAFWEPSVELLDGIIKLSEWYGSLQDKQGYEVYTKK